jgi:dolichyl-phosphate beta-glucosyltransferase
MTPGAQRRRASGPPLTPLRPDGKLTPTPIDPQQSPSTSGPPEVQPQLSIVVPAFNEAHRLAGGFERLHHAVGVGAIDLDRTEIIVVDDGSTDDTSGCARLLLADLPHYRLVRLSVNHGKGAAVRAGVTRARGVHTAYMDADMSIDPRSVPDLLDRLQTNDIAIGSRALADSMVEGRYVVRLLMGRLFNRLVTAGTNLDFLDTQCGFKAFRTEAARLLFHLVRIDRFAFDVEILACAHRLGLSIAEVPVQWKHVQGSSIQPLRDSLTMMADVYQSRVGLRTPPTVPAVAMTGPAGEPGGIDVRQQTAFVRRALSSDADAVPLPVLTRQNETLVLFPLVDPFGITRTTDLLRHSLTGMEITHRSLSVADLLALRPLSSSGPR